MNATVNRQILLVEKPTGKLGPEHFKLAKGTIPEPKDGEALVRTRYISLDAANRAWMHGATYRAAVEDEWREFLGVTSRRHDHMSRYPVVKTAPNHPILSGMPDGWTTPMDELYIVEKVWPDLVTLANSRSERDGKDYPVIWTHHYGRARVFGTTYGHSDETFSDPVFLDYVSRGLLWAAGVPLK